MGAEFQHSELYQKPIQFHAWRDDTMSMRLVMAWASDPTSLKNGNPWVYFNKPSKPCDFDH